MAAPAFTAEKPLMIVAVTGSAILRNMQEVNGPQQCMIGGGCETSTAELICAK